MNLLIVGKPGDNHVGAVLWALAEASMRHNRSFSSLYYWVPSDFPVKQLNSLRITSQKGLLYDLRVYGGEKEEWGFPIIDVVWMRRLVNPTIPTQVHPADIPAAERESKSHITGMLEIVAPQAFWVNPLITNNRSSKTNQLSQAVAVGLQIPDTLMSNDPQAIRAFYDQYAGNVILKGHVPASWKKKDGTFVSNATSLLTHEVVANDLALRYCPGIYQPLLQKKTEVRLTMIGQHAFAVRLSNADPYAARIDWRVNQTSLRAEPIDLPAPIYRRCQDLMQRLGLVFGCFDFVIDPNDEWIFLEVNEMGQFLWVEEHCPDMPLLATFIGMLLAGKSEFNLNEIAPIRLADYRGSTAEQEFLKQEKEQRVPRKYSLTTEE